MVNVVDLLNKEPNELLKNWEVAELIELKKKIEQKLNEVKEYILLKKIEEVWAWTYKIKRVVSRTYKPVDVDLFLQRYPMEKYKDMYKINVDVKKARKIVDDPNLFQIEVKEYVTIKEMKPKQEEDDLP